MNTNDFSKRKIGDKLWSIQPGDCEVRHIGLDKIIVSSGIWNASYLLNGNLHYEDRFQSLFFSNPNIIAPPEPPRLPDYKPGQWIAVWNNASPVISKYCGFSDSGKCETWESNVYIQLWDNHCTIEELPEVLAKWGEK